MAGKDEILNPWNVQQENSDVCSAYGNEDLRSVPPGADRYLACIAERGGFVPPETVVRPGDLC